MKSLKQLFCGFATSICQEPTEDDSFHPHEWSISGEALRNLAKQSFPGVQLHIWDRQFFYTSNEDWNEVVRRVLFNMPTYTAEKFDCENFALLCSARTCEAFQLNTMGLAIGRIPAGYHGFNVFLARYGEETEFYILEPQTGIFVPAAGETEYQVEEVIFG